MDHVKEKTDSYLGQLGGMENKVRAVFQELDSRRNFAVFLMFVFIAIGVTAYLLSRTYGK